MDTTPSILSSGSDVRLRRAWRTHAGERAGRLRELSTGRRIHRGADDPAGLVAAENLRARGRQIDAAFDAADRAAAVAGTVGSAVAQMSELLLDLKAVVGAAAGTTMTREERSAAQLQVDRVVGQVKRLYTETKFNGVDLLRGQPATPEPIPTIDFSTLTQGGYGSGQDVSGGAAVGGGGSQVSLNGNSWKYFLLDAPYSITADTTLEFDFSSTDQGELHAIALTHGGGASPTPDYTKFFVLDGTQNVSNQIQFHNGLYPAGSGTVRSYKIRVGDFYTGPADRIGFENDNDSGTGNSVYRNVKLYEDVPPPATSADGLVEHAFNLAADAGRRPVTMSYTEPNPSRLGTGTASLSNLVSGAGFDLHADNLTEVGRAIDAAVEQLAVARARVGAFVRHGVGATRRGLEAAEAGNLRSLARIEDADIASAAAEVVRRDVILSNLPSMQRAGRDAATRLLGLLPGLPV